ncbi:MAG: hypothetical protein SF052_14610 [Bacteroidia bacterium]|nr:hypothetical protein [Bacteroidia bacterium]
MKTTLTPLHFKKLILGFWGLYFVLVFASNLTDGLRATGFLEKSIAFASGNYDLVARVTAIYSTPAWLVALMFVGLLVWELLAGILFFRAWRWQNDPARARSGSLTAFTFSIALWCAFILADEFFIAFEVGNLESTHIRLLVAEVVCLLAVDSIANTVS